LTAFRCATVCQGQAPSGKLQDSSPYRVILTRLEPVGHSQFPTECWVMNFGVDRNAKRAVHSASCLFVFINRRSFQTVLHSIVCDPSLTLSFLLPRLKLRAGAPCALARLSPCCVAELFRRRNTNSFAANRSFRFTPRMNSGGPHREQRTSCVLWPPRILSDARFPQHACKGALPPLTPTKEGTDPLCWILSLSSAGGRA
jgi:hypothetical protein